MQPHRMTVFDVFGQKKRYVVPLYQRPYVWNEQDQWEPLWREISEQATSLLEEEPRAPHFLGTVVLKQMDVFGKQVAASQIIDGQQRLTTLQVLLKVARDLVVDPALATDLDSLTTNTGVRQEEFERFKVWPTNIVRTEFAATMTAGSLAKLAAMYPSPTKRGRDTRPLLARAYEYFHEAIKTYMGMGDVAAPSNGVVTSRLEALLNVFAKRLHFIVIDLEEADDPQVIFETLNYLGVPLQPSDLIKNFIFLRASRQQENPDELYQKFWEPYDTLPAEKPKNETDHFWSCMERQGRMLRPRLDLFLHHYVQYKTERDTNIGRVFREFQDWWGDGKPPRSVGTALEELKRHSEVFRGFFVPDKSSRAGVFAHRVRLLDTSTLYPLLLYLMVEMRDRVDPEEMNEILVDLESYLVRRAVCQLTTKNYNRSFLTMLRDLRKAGVLDRTGVQRLLMASDAEISRWPDDDEYRRHWLADPSYEHLGPNRARMVLEAIDLYRLTNRQERLHIEEDLTVEHVLPQAWEEHWTLPVSSKALGPSEETPHQRRERLLHSFGNLTLLTQPLNSSLRNRPMADKGPVIARDSVLRLNNYFQGRTEWDEEAIVERGRHLFEDAVVIWPRPR